MHISSKMFNSQVDSLGLVGYAFVNLIIDDILDDLKKSKPLYWSFNLKQEGNYCTVLNMNQ
jgi:hypothetical protein